jgi:pimeloyl-ACP methyl ester carboxylesterase
MGQVMKAAALLAVAAAALALAAPAEAALRFKHCGPYGFQCARMSVPLDRTGAVAGRVSLLVKRIRARRRPARSALFVLAGGPGQSATEAFGEEALSVLYPAYRRRDLIVFDQRGTGRSGVLRCRAIERSNLLDAAGAAARCANRIGPRRAFYTSRDSVEDMEAIRVALGYERIALFGTSYGTKVALGYALGHPASVERIVLDSVVEAEGPNPLYLDTLEAVPRVIRTLCRAGCRDFTHDPVADVRRLVPRLAEKRLRGRVVDARGHARRTSMDRTDLFIVFLAGDLNPALRAAFPGAVRAALAGDAAALLRLRSRAFQVDGAPPPPRILSSMLYTATTCEETPFPWLRTTPPDAEARRAQTAAAAAAVPARAFLPFDRTTVIENDLTQLCERWPAAPAAPVFGPGPPPNVPVLLIEGEDDLRTPVENARRVAELFPRSRLLVAPETGHAALGADPTGCTNVAFGRFMQGRRFTTRCARRQRIFRPLSPPPTSLATVAPARRVRGIRGRVLTGIALTLRDLIDDALTALILDVNDPDLARGGGLRSGRYRIDGRDTLWLQRLAFVRGLRLSGRVRNFGLRNQRGRIRVHGRGAIPGGVVTIRSGVVRGTLGGRSVRARLSPPVAEDAARAAAARQSCMSPAKNVASIVGKSSSSTASGSSRRSSATPLAIAKVISVTCLAGIDGSTPRALARSSSRAAIRSRRPR